jgi:uncharacterized protein (TIGR00730 family)
MKEHLLEYIDKAKSQGVRGLRILTEYFYATEIFDPIVKSGIKIVSVFGSARRKPGTWEYEATKKLGALLYQNGYAVVTGASAGIMQAANEGVAQGIITDLKKKKKYKSDQDIITSPEFKKTLFNHSVGLKISLPFEPVNNPFVGVYATFHYFMVRKFFFGALSSAFIACEGGWGTRDELFEILTLVQTGKAPLMPIIYISPDPDHLLNDIKYCIKKEYISPDDQSLLEVIGDHRKAVDIINRFYSVVDSISYDNKPNTIDVYLKKPLTGAQQKKVETLINKKYKVNFSNVIFTKDKMELSGFNYRSYGILRKLIDSIS